MSAHHSIGIRREDKNRWERRVAIIPEHIPMLAQQHGIEILVQSSQIRVYEDDEYLAAGANIRSDLIDASIIIGVKEIPPAKLLRDKIYLFFSHTIKGQSYNMPMLKRLMELNCTLIDYEKVTDEAGRRLIFFGRFAGIAGMTDTLWAFGQRMHEKGVLNPFYLVKQSYKYRGLGGIDQSLKSVADVIRTEGIPESMQPLVVGFAGYGNVSKGAQYICDQLPHIALTPRELMETDDLSSVYDTAHNIFSVVFKEEDMVRRRDGGPFELQEYYKQPELYEGIFSRYTDKLSILMNCIYWDTMYPRLVTRSDIKRLYGPGNDPHLQIIGDISCDVDGAIEINTHVTEPDYPVYVYDPVSDTTISGYSGPGPAVLAVDILPSELPRAASKFFSNILIEFLPSIALADFSVPFDDLVLPESIKRAIILYHGSLTESYTFMNKFLD